jgi:hypothetical protein
MRVEIASPPDREKLVAQIMVDQEQWAEINQERVELEVEFYPRQDGKPWVVPFDAALQALEEGRRRLSGTP